MDKRKPKRITIEWDGGPLTVITGNLVEKLVARANELGVDVGTLIIATLRAQVTFNKVIEKERKVVKDADQSTLQA